MTSSIGGSSNQNVDVVFLDIDGVLLPYGDEQKEEACCSGLFPDRTLAAFSHLLTTTRAVVVLSSTWRVRSDFREDALTAFRDYGDVFGGPLKGMTEFYDVTDVNTHAERQWEIHDWCIANHDKIRSWVALDDEELIEGETRRKYRSSFIGHVVKTECSIGLTMKDAQRAIKLLKKQLKSKR
jgi:hypothetical protein